MGDWYFAIPVIVLGKLPAAHTLRRPSSLTDIPSLTLPDRYPLSPSTHRYKRSKIQCQSTSSLLTVGKSAAHQKPKRSRIQKPFHCIAPPQHYESAQEAITSPKLSYSTIASPTRDENDNQAATDSQQPEIVLSMMYDTMTASLTVTVICILNLDDILEQQAAFYVQALLRPKNYHKQRTQAILVTAMVEINECFFFEKVKISDLPTCHLMLTVNKASNKKVAELFINMATAKLDYGVTSHFKYPLVTVPRSRKVSEQSPSFLW